MRSFTVFCQINDVEYKLIVKTNGADNAAKYAREYFLEPEKVQVTAVCWADGRTELEVAP